MSFNKIILTLLIYQGMLFTPLVWPANGKFITIEKLYHQPQPGFKLLPYSINLVSSSEPVAKNTLKNLDKLDTDLLYLNKVNVGNVVYYRLVTGNYITQSQAQKRLHAIKQLYPQAWINVRTQRERQQLSQLLQQNRKSHSSASTTIAVSNHSIKNSIISKPEFADSLLKQAKQELLNENYARVIAISDKVVETGNIDQQQKAMELAGIVRERQRKYAQAIAIYNRYLNLYPESDNSARIKNRLAGLKTMSMEPKSRISDNRKQASPQHWNIYGTLSQYYRDDVIDQQNEPSKSVNSILSTDVNLFARRKTDADALVFRFDGGLLNDFIDDTSDARISRAMVSYSNNESGYQLTGGRQTRTAKGVFGRFDGLVYKILTADIDYSLYAGYPVQSTYDGLETEKNFIGASVNFSLLQKVDIDIYLLNQKVSDLTDRQLLGTEFQYRNDRGFLFGTIEYDLFFSDLNSITAISNYRYSEQWVFNLTYDYRNAPLLSTTNALQGQAVTQISELQDLFTDDEIYQLAEDRTSKSQNIFVGSSYQIDDARQFYLSLSLTSIKSTVESGNVSATAASDSVYLAADYSIRGYFFANDYSTVGLRLSDTSTANIISLRARTRFSGENGLRYDPRIRIEYRESKSSDVNQWIVNPSFKISYKQSKKLSFEASAGIEFSNFNLPELNDQTAYSVLLGYVYQF